MFFIRNAIIKVILFVYQHKITHILHYINIVLIVMEKHFFNSILNEVWFCGKFDIVLEFSYSITFLLSHNVTQAIKILKASN